MMLPFTAHVNSEWNVSSFVINFAANVYYESVKCVCALDFTC